MVEKEQSRQGTSSENVETWVISPPSPLFHHVKWKRARIKKSGAPSSEQLESQGNIVLKVVTISWLKQLDDLSTMVVFVQLDKGLDLNYILEFHNDSYPPPPKRAKLK